MNQGQNQKMPDAEARATAHFDNYVGPVIRLEQKHAYELVAPQYNAGVRELVAQLQEQAYQSIRLHYITSHVHGTKHGIADALAAAKGLAGIPAKGGIAECKVDGPIMLGSVSDGGGFFVGVEPTTAKLQVPEEPEVSIKLKGEGAPVYYGSMGEVSDGYHTFNELYEHRHALFLALMALMGPDLAWYSGVHGDGSPAYPGWLLCGVDLPEQGTVTYHLPEGLLPEIVGTGATRLDKGKKWDGHTAADVVTRLKAFAAK